MEFPKANNNHSEVLHTAAELRDLVDLAEWGGEILNRHVTVSEAAGWTAEWGAQTEKVLRDAATFIKLAELFMGLADEPVAA